MQFHKVICAAVLTAVMAAAPVYAAEETVIYQTNSGTVADAFQVAQRLLNENYTASAYVTLDGVKATQKGNEITVCVSKEGMETLKENELLADRYFQAHCLEFARDGMTADEVVNSVAYHVADRMEYDYAASDQNSSLIRASQSARRFFTEGMGLCVTYTTAFNSLVSRVPFDPVTMTVNYNAKEHAYLNTEYVSATDHAWSAVQIGSDIKYMDVTFFDCTKNARWLNMGDAEINDAEHQGSRACMYKYTVAAMPQAK